MCTNAAPARATPAANKRDGQDDRIRGGAEASALVVLAEALATAAAAGATIVRGSYATALSTTPKVEKCDTVTAHEHAPSSPLVHTPTGSGTCAHV